MGILPIHHRVEFISSQTAIMPHCSDLIPMCNSAIYFIFCCFIPHITMWLYDFASLNFCNSVFLFLILIFVAFLFNPFCLLQYLVLLSFPSFRLLSFHALVHSVLLLIWFFHLFGSFVYLVLSFIQSFLHLLYSLLPLLANFVSSKIFVSPPHLHRFFVYSIDPSFCACGSFLCSICLSSRQVYLVF